MSKLQKIFKQYVDDNDLSLDEFKMELINETMAMLLVMVNADGGDQVEVTNGNYQLTFKINPPKCT